MQSITENLFMFILIHFVIKTFLVFFPTKTILLNFMLLLPIWILWYRI